MPKRVSPRGAVAAVFLVLVLAAGAATWTLTSRTEATTRRPTGPSTAELAKRLPFFGLLYERTAAQTQVAEAQRQLAVDCMAQHGFAYRPVPVARPADSADEQPTTFGLESLAPPPSAPPAAAPAEEPHDPAFARALFGDPDKRLSAAGKTIRVTRPADGCQAEAEQRLLGGDRLHWLQYRIQLGDGEKEARQQLEHDPQFRTANERWRRCLRDVGYDQKDPVALMYGLPRDTDFAHNPLARADVRCKEHTGYLTTAYTRLDAEQKNWLTQHSALLTSWNALQLRQEKTAREVLAARH
ncbi:hypothetical protein ACIBCO_25435 [Streptomyces violascens]|uniref:hypothetical protein n=1 Tax=Streptomyces violascens TaxID=67381 RepID=UPI0037BC77BB